MTVSAPTSTLRLTRQPDGTMVATGEIDPFTAPALREALEGALVDPLREQTLDLRGVRHLDSAGLGVLFQYAHRLRVVVAPNTIVARIVAISGLTHAARVQFAPPGPPRPRA